MLYCPRNRNKKGTHTQTVFENYEAEVRELEAKTFGANAAPVPPGSIVFYGSSSMRLWDTMQADLEPLTGNAHRRCVNLGFGGSTIGACVHFFDRLPGRVQRESPPVRSVIFFAGENDLGDGQSVDAVFDRFIWLHAMVRDQFPGVPFAFISVKPSPSRTPVLSKIVALNARIRERVNERPESVFVDVLPEMLDASGKPRLELWTDDGIHLSRTGYDLWTQILGRYRETLFE